MASNPPETKVEQRVLSKGPTAPGQPGADGSDEVQMPHERDESVGGDSTSGQGSGAAGENQRRVAQRAADDLEQGQVDTDLRATPGLDAERRGRIAGPPAKRHR